MVLDEEPVNFIEKFSDGFLHSFRVIASRVIMCRKIK